VAGLDHDWGWIQLHKMGASEPRNEDGTWSHVKAKMPQNVHFPIGFKSVLLSVEGNQNENLWSAEQKSLTLSFTTCLTKSISLRVRSHEKSIQMKDATLYGRRTMCKEGEREK
jgi:hypothetical protein